MTIPTIPGMDVSKWQRSVPWTADASKVQFAIMKATEGALTPGTSDASAVAQFGLDPDFRTNWAQSRVAGLVRGAYHFMRPDLGNSADAEAAWFLSVVGTLEPGDFLALDAECAGGNWGAWVREWLAHIKAHVGFWPLLYTFRSWPAAHGVTFAGVGNGAGLWLSAPDVNSAPPPVAGWPFVAIWQKAAGVPGGDIFLGTRDQLLKYGKPGLAGGTTGVVVPSPPPPPAPLPPPVPPRPTPVIPADVTPRSLQDILVALLRWLLDWIRNK